MEVNINKAWRDVQTGYVDHLLRLTRLNILGNCRNLPGGNRNIRNFVDVIGGVNDMTAFQEKVVV